MIPAQASQPDQGLCPASARLPLVRPESLAIKLLPQIPVVARAARCAGLCGLLLLLTLPRFVFAAVFQVEDVRIEGCSASPREPYLRPCR